MHFKKNKMTKHIELLNVPGGMARTGFEGGKEGKGGAEGGGGSGLGVVRGNLLCPGSCSGPVSGPGPGLLVRPWIPGSGLN